MFCLTSPWLPMLKLTIASCFQSVEMMMFAALRDIRVRGYRDHGTILSTVLPNIAALMPLEAAMDKAGKRSMQTFPPLFNGIRRKHSGNTVRGLQSGKADREKRAAARPLPRLHFREVAEHVTFEGGLLQKWVVDALFRCVEVHIRLIDQPPKGAEAFTETVYKRLRPFIYVHARFFRGKVGFGYRHASDACGDFAILGTALIQRQHPKLAEECGATISAIAQSAAASNPNSYLVYGWGDCMVKLEVLARAADALGQNALAAGDRARCSRPEYISEPDWAEYADAMKNRTRHMNRELGECARNFD
jgi:hypothetical protein